MKAHCYFSAIYKQVEEHTHIQGISTSFFLLGELTIPVDKERALWKTYSKNVEINTNRYSRTKQRKARNGEKYNKQHTM